MASLELTRELSIVDHSDVWKKKLCRNFKVLVDCMDVATTVDDLLSQDVLDLEEKEMIENAIPNTTYNKSRIIIKLLLHKTKEGFEIFLRSLIENGNEEIASQVNNTDIHVSTLPEVTSDKMLDLKRKIFRSFDKIVGSMILSNFLDDFVSHGLFEVKDMEMVLNVITSVHDCNHKFLNILFKKDDGFQLLFQLIESENKQLARKIRDTDVDVSVDNEILHHISEDKIPRNIRRQADIRLDNWKSAMYVKVRASETVFDAINDNTIVTITGNPGSGKTATIHHVALRLAAKGFAVIPVDCVEEIKNYLDPDLKQVFVLDDPVGVHSLDGDELGRWIKFNATLECLSVSNTKVLCSIRKTIVSEDNFNVRDNILNKNIVDLQDGRNSLQDEERLKILEQHLIGKQYTITDEMKKGILHIKDYFPLMCKLFASDEKFRKLGLKFFLEPFDIIKNEIDDMLCNDKLGYCALILCFLENNSLSLDLFDPLIIGKSKRNSIENVMECCGLSRNLPLPSFKEKLGHLETVFLQREGNSYKFVHDMINDVVAYQFGSKYPEQIIKQSSSKFLCERVVVSQDQLSADNKYVVLLDKKYFSVLVERLLHDMKQGRYFHVFSNKCWDNPAFMESFKKFFLAKRQNFFIKGFRGKFENKQDIIQFFCGTIKKYDIADELEHTAPVDTWTWYYNAMHCLQIKGTSLLHWVVTFAHRDLFKFIWKSFSPEQKKKVIDKVPLIHFACLGGNVDICEKLLQVEKSMITQPFEKIFGELPLHYAAACNPYVIDLLIDNGAEVNAKSPVSGRTPILLAAAYGNIDTVRRLILYNADINIPDSEKLSALLLSCQNGHEDISKLLIDHGADVNLCNNNGASPLYFSSQNNYSGIVQLLLDHGADVNLCRNTGASPLFISSEYNHSVIVQLLLDHGVDVNLCDNDGTGPLYISSEYNHSDIVQLLLDHGADVNLCRNDGTNPLYISSKKNHRVIVQLLLDHGANVNLCRNDGVSPLYISSQKKHSDIVQLLLDHGADVNLCYNDGVSPLYISSQKKHSAIVQLLLDHGADVNLCRNDGTSPLYISSQKNHSDIVQLLLDHGADVNLCYNDGVSPLYISSQKKHSAIVQLLLDHGADVNLCRNDGTNPLYISSKKNHRVIVQLLLDHGANVNLCRNDGVSPLYISSQNNHSDIVQLLLDHGADVNKCNKGGLSPLIIACYHNNPECTKLLLDTGKCLIDHQDKFGKTALFKAADVNDTKSTELLIKHGCDVNIRNKNGETALDIAKEKNSKGVVNLLKGSPSHKKF